MSQSQVERQGRGAHGARLPRADRPRPRRRRPLRPTCPAVKVAPARAITILAAPTVTTLEAADRSVEDREVASPSASTVALRIDPRRPDDDGARAGRRRRRTRTSSASSSSPRFKIPVDINLDTSDVSGPSAGLAMTLAIIDALTPGDLTGGKRVAVTGTIDPDGNVGEIGGLPQKAVAARPRARADLHRPGALYRRPAARQDLATATQARRQERRAAPGVDARPGVEGACATPAARPCRHSSKT